MLFERQMALEDWLGNLITPERINHPAVKALLGVSFSFIMLKILFF